jgi:hypothetical protein
MTARRRRKSGSGPSATALIAWVSGAQASVGEPASAPVSVIDGRSSGQVPGGRAIFLGRACGLAAGTLLACGSVLAGATHAGDGSLAGDGAPLLNHTPAVPGAGTGTGTPDEYRGSVPAGRTSAAPDMVSAQAVADASPAPHPRLGRVRRNNPVSLDMPAEPSRNSGTAQQPWGSSLPPTGDAPSGPIAPVSPVLDPAAKRVGRVAPVGGVLVPTNSREERAGSPHGGQAGSLRDEPAASPRDERTSLSASKAVATVKQVVAPVHSAIPPAIHRAIHPATQPAMAMLTSLLPVG